LPGLAKAQAWFLLAPLAEANGNLGMFFFFGLKKHSSF
jgi:hypothetical protein